MDRCIIMLPSKVSSFDVGILKWARTKCTENCASHTARFFLPILINLICKKRATRAQASDLIRASEFRAGVCLVHFGSKKSCTFVPCCRVTVIVAVVPIFRS